jgi:lambda repressor-like predicted transcriptional regulator
MEAVECVSPQTLKSVGTYPGSITPQRRIRDLVKECGTLASAARSCGIDQTALRKILLKKFPVSPQVAAKLGLRTVVVYYLKEESRD